MHGKAILLVIVGIAFLFFLNVIFLSYETVKYPDYASAATTTVVDVTAKVLEEISCATDVSSTDFGTLSSGSITDSTPNASTTMSCANVGVGCTLYVKDAYAGLATSSPAYTIPSPNAALDASTTLSEGVEGYGLQATTTSAGSGDTLDLGPRYVWDNGNDVAGLTTNNQIVASTNATSSEREVVITHKAAIATETQAGIYEDTITYECAATP